ncbi:MAG: L-seryl-tRNA(Sec) selenium transferase, partial [Chloroflexi bacterium]
MRVVEDAREDWVEGPEPVINATGVILHTNLGRAPLSREAVASTARAAAYCDLEYEKNRGTRGSRHDRVRALPLALTDAEGAHVTVNNASAVLLSLTALARRKEVI